MRVVLQRVTSASVTIDGTATGEIGPGLVLLLGIAKDDTPRDVDYVSTSAYSFGFSVTSTER